MKPKRTEQNHHLKISIQTSNLSTLYTHSAHSIATMASVLTHLWCTYASQATTILSPACCHSCFSFRSNFTSSALLLLLLFQFVGRIFFRRMVFICELINAAFLFFVILFSVFIRVCFMFFTLCDGSDNIFADTFPCSFSLCVLLLLMSHLPHIFFPPRPHSVGAWVWFFLCLRLLADKKMSYK